MYITIVVCNGIDDCRTGMHHVSHESRRCSSGRGRAARGLCAGVDPRTPPRGGSELAAARAEAATLRSSHQMAAASLAAASGTPPAGSRRPSGPRWATSSIHYAAPSTSSARNCAGWNHGPHQRLRGAVEQVRGMHQTSHRLQDQTRALTNALHTPHVRGRWGEVQLERVVELSGMSRHCGFSTQVSRAGSRGDDRRASVPTWWCICHRGRDIVVDSQVPLHAYLETASENRP